MAALELSLMVNSQLGRRPGRIGYTLHIVYFEFILNTKVYFFPTFLQTTCSWLVDLF
jgi:hypothetical protein